MKQQELTEQEEDRMNRAFAAEAWKVFAEAREEMLEVSGSVVEVEEGKLYRIYRDGKRELLGEVPHSLSVEVGTKVHLKPGK